LKTINKIGKLFQEREMSYCTLEEAFQTSISDSVLPPSRQQFEEPGKGEKGRLKPRRHKRSPLPPQEPSVVEPDRAAHNYKQTPELLGAQPRNDTSTSISSYLIGVNDPGEDYFPYPHGAGDEHGFDKSFMLEPNWSDQFIDRIPGQQTETPPLPGAAVDGYSTLYRKVPYVQSKNDEKGTTLKAEEIRDEIKEQHNPTSLMGAATINPELQKRIDDIFSKIDQLEISRGESNHSEIILFVMTGIFVLLMLDLLLKQGCKALGSIATAAAVSPMHGGFAHPFFL
jgi:hypothetical protein